MMERMARPHRQHPPHRHDHRQRLAQEAARWMAESGVQDYALAKRKAARRLGLAEDVAGLPRNAEIQAALREHQRLFQQHTQPAALRQRREAALQALEFFARFTPRVLSARCLRELPMRTHL